MFSNRLKYLRKEKGLTQTELAKLLNSSLSKVAMWETQKRDPIMEDLLKLSDIFNVSTDYLLGKTDIKNMDNKVNINKDEKDVEELIEETMSQILNQEGLMLNGEIIDDNDLILLRNAIKNGIEYAKSMKSKK
ncbi:helix-turn-helix transcriptional regulator [Clostridium sp. CCUG 7971]|uniref:helix-turn-helix domain-containing protein n=1 Tax=Clostridium sp. CCUG 7971 TaxID=2811414 RepID=UPI001ABBA1D4|nr:helix-turn-helix transcriptional regulator [Clostridium sp. CCUG 7971]MBO3446381.1 helix-turn-helix transcriptional regulator [Clostridium sp. CCUG 7971]